MQHGDKYSTLYAHMSRFGSGVKRGKRVEQGQTIGYVGKTGLATGPHLHYEFLMNGVHRNPRTIHKKLPKAKSLASTEMPRFKEAIRQASSQLASIREDKQLAMNDGELNAE